MVDRATWKILERAGAQVIMRPRLRIPGNGGLANHADGRIRVEPPNYGVLEGGHDAARG